MAVYFVYRSHYDNPGCFYVKRFEAEAKCPVMHRDQSFGPEFEKGLHRFLWIHVNFAAGRRLIGANRKERDVDLVTVPDFLKPGKVSAVAAVKNRASVRRDNKSAKIAMQIGEESRAPVMTGRE